MAESTSKYPSRSPERRQAIVAVFGLCLLAVVAAAAGSWAPVAAHSGGSRRFAVLAVLVAVGLVWLAIAGRLGGAQAARVVRVFGGASLMTIAAVVFASLAIGLFWSHSAAWSPWSCHCGQGLPWGAGGGGTPGKNEGGSGLPGRKLHRGAGNGDWVLVEGSLAAAAAVGLAGLAACSWWRRRRRLVVESAAVSPLVAFVDESVEDLRAEKDVRRAIEACYARMERTLGRVGLVRRAAEAPLEFLARVGVRLGVTRSSLERLTGLFEEAKFSRHALTEPTREEAINALLALRAEATA